MGKLVNITTSAITSVFVEREVREATNVENYMDKYFLERCVAGVETVGGCTPV